MKHYIGYLFYLFVHLFILFLFFEIWNTVYNFKTSLQNLAAGIQQNKQNTHKSMLTLGTIVYNSDLFSDLDTIKEIKFVKKILQFIK